MKVFVIFSALVAVAAGQFNIIGSRIIRQSGSASPIYGPPQREFERPESKPSRQPEVEDYQPQIFKHVYVHAAPDEPADEQARTIRVPGGDKHVNIIFVKTPSQSSQSETEVILPEQDEQKNLVYVLLKKNEAESNIKIRRPQAKQPTKPEVYFIRYKDQEQEQQQQNGGPSNGGYSQGPSSNGNGHHSSQNGNGHHSSQNGNGGYTQQNGHHDSQPQTRPAPQHRPSPPPTFDFDGPSGPPPSAPQHHDNGNHGNGIRSEFSDAGRYTPAVAPGVIRGPGDAPSSGYGVPL